MSDTHRTVTITYDAIGDAGMTLAELGDRVHSMREDGIPNDAVVRVETIGGKNRMGISQLTASDRPQVSE